MKTPFKWDHFSDQPEILRDKKFKKMMRKRELSSLTKTFFISLFILPLSYLLMIFVKKRAINSKYFFGIGVNLDKQPSLSVELVKELNVDSVLIRVPLWEMLRIDEYVEFAKEFRDKKIVINIMQDREHIEDTALLKSDLRAIFQKFGFVKEFQIGTTINRAKWGFFSASEYLKFYKTAYDLKQNEFNDILLIGSNVIDFEYHFSAHTLFNFSHVRYDILGSLLYVDRRGAPENTQMGFDLFKKIKLLTFMMMISQKSAQKLYITETNYPISNTAPYAPTSEHECVSEDDYARFMVRYFLISYATQNVDSVFWHQLIASGYGLIDERQGVRKRSAFYALQTLIKHLKESEVLSYKISGQIHTLKCMSTHGELDVMWSVCGDRVVTFHDDIDVYDMFDQRSCLKSVSIDQNPKYVYITL